MLSVLELRRLPKVDLHLHLAGSASPRTLARLEGRGGRWSGAAERAGGGFATLRDFLDVYSSVSMRVRSGEDVLELVLGLGEDLAMQGVVYAEVSVTPETHISLGMPAEELAEALTHGRDVVRIEHGIQLAWIYDINALRGRAGARVTVHAALNHPPSGLVAIGLGGTESVGRAVAVEAFSEARAAGLHTVAHAGETVGPEQVRYAVDVLRAQRVGHGVSAVQDPSLLAHLAEAAVPLEICLSSNVATGAVANLDAHPLPRLIDAGVRVTLGTDDPGIFNIDLVDEYRKAQKAFQLSTVQVMSMLETAVESSFASQEQKLALRRQLADAGSQLSCG